MFMREKTHDKIMQAKEQEIDRLEDEKDSLQLKNVKAKKYAQEVERQINELLEIDSKGYSEETKKKNKNLILNNIKTQSTKIIKELISDYQSQN